MSVHQPIQEMTLDYSLIHSIDECYEPIAAWFHGNASGQYSPNADGTLIVPVRSLVLTSPLELTYWANWDMQRGYYDNSGYGLRITAQLDNNELAPGVPGQGISEFSVPQPPMVGES